MEFDKYTVRQFINGVFGHDYSEKGIPQDKCETVYFEYIDAAGLYETEEFQKVTYISYINNRINSISIAIRLQREMVDNFDIAYLPGLEFFYQYGHRPKWKDDKEDFLKQLDKIEKRELKYTSMIENKIKELTEFRLKKNKGEQPVELSRIAFIRTVNSLGKVGYKIDNNSTTVEELALMIKQQTEEAKAISK